MRISALALLPLSLVLGCSKGCTADSSPPKSAPAVVASTRRQAAQDTLRVLGVSEKEIASTIFGFDSANDARFDGEMMNAIALSPCSISIDWRAFASEPLKEIKRCVAPRGFEVSVGEDDHDGWVVFSVTAAGRTQRLRARHRGGPDGDNGDDFMTGIAPLVAPSFVTLAVVPARLTDTTVYVLVTPQQEAELRRMAGEWYAHWFGRLEPTGAAIVLPFDG